MMTAVTAFGDTEAFRSGFEVGCRSACRPRSNVLECCDALDGSGEEQEKNTHSPCEFVSLARLLIPAFELGKWLRAKSRASLPW